MPKYYLISFPISSTLKSLVPHRQFIEYRDPLTLNYWELDWMKFYSFCLVLKMQLLNEMMQFSTGSCCKIFINWFQTSFFF